MNNRELQQPILEDRDLDRLPFPSAISWLMGLVSVAAPDEETARAGRIFNVTMLVAAASLAVMGFVFLLAVARGLLPDSIGLRSAGLVFVMAPFPLSYVFLAKRGYVRQAINFYSWSQILTLGALVLLVDGRYSAGWLFFSWSITLTGVLIRPSKALVLGVAVVVFYLLVMGLEFVGVYVPPIQFDMEIRIFYLMTFGFVSLITTSAIMTFVNMRSFNHAMNRSLDLNRRLEIRSQELQQYLQERSDEIQRLSRDFSTVAELGRSISRITDFQTLLNTAVSIISQRFDFPYVAVFLLDEERHWLVRVAMAIQGEFVVSDVELRRQLGEEGLVGYTADLATLYVAADVSRDPRYLPLDMELEDGMPLDVRFEAVVPLTEQGRVIGVLDVRSDKGRRLDDSGAFGELDELALQALADTLSIIIESTRRHEETRRTLMRLSEYEQQEAAARWRQLLLKRKDRLAYLYDRVRVASYAPQEIDGNLPFSLSELYGPYVYERSDGTQVLLVPLKTRNTTVGHLSFESDSMWTDEDIAMVDTVVAQLGLALENARLLEETQRNAFFEQTASTVTARIRSEVEIEAVLQRALQELGQALEVDRGRAKLVISDQQEAW